MSEHREQAFLSGKEAQRLVAERPGARVAILGGGITGRSLAKLFLSAGLQPVIVDESCIEDRADLVDQGVCVIDRWNASSAELFLAEADRPMFAVASPSVLRTNGMWLGMSQFGVPVISEMDFALAYLGQPTVAITGTNGKTTTVSLLAHLFASAGRRILLLGNVGTPFSAAIDPGLLSGVLQAGEMPQGDYTDNPVLIAEVSSYQLDSTRELKPLVAGCLNITIDHLEKHGDMQRYVEAKSHVFQWQGESDLSLYYADDPQVRAAVDLARRRGGLGRDCPVYITHDAVSCVLPDVCGRQDAVRIVEGMDGCSLVIRLDGVEERCELTGMQLWGAHNMLNIGVAVAACRFVGLSIAEIESGLRTFQPLEHRLEIVPAERGIWVNDSKSTNIDSVAVALRAVIARFPLGRIYLMIGGISKGGDWQELLPLFSDRVVEIVLFGRDRWEIAKSLILDPFARQIAAGARSEIPLERGQLESCDGESLSVVEDAPFWVCFSTLRQAVDHVKAEVCEGDIVLLSPGGASFDEFRNYEHRGLEFKSMIR